MALSIIKPHHLKKGDTVALVSLSRPITRRASLNPGIKTLKNMGLKVVFSENIFKNYGCYMAGTARERVDELHKLIANKKVRAIFNTGGGLAANQLLDKIDFRLMRHNRKIFYGFSDIGSMLNPIFEKTGMITFHGPTLEYWDEGLDRFSKRSLHTTLFEPKKRYDLRGPSTWHVLKPGHARGRLGGGNLTIIRNFLGTPYDIEWKNRILFWEDIGEDLEGMDSMLTHLRLSGVFRKIAGMIIGKNLIAGPEQEIRTPMCRMIGFRRTLLNILRGYTFPIVSNVDFGHKLPNITIPVGARAELIAYPDRTVRIRILEHVVA